MLDKVLKGMMLVFAIVTVIAVVAALSAGPITAVPSSVNTILPEISLSSAASIALMVALAGWMPTSLELSVWHSLLTLSRKKQTQHAASVREVIF